jgi:hypothetical protein
MLTQTTQRAAKHARWLNKRGFAQDNNFILKGLTAITVDSIVDQEAVDAYTSDTICTFLERPSILEYASDNPTVPIPTGWVEGATYTENIAPLSSHLSKTMFKSKLASYNYFKFKTLKIRVAVSCSPFHFGTLDIRWHPLAIADDFGSGAASFGPPVPDSISAGLPSVFVSQSNGDLCRRSTCTGSYLHIADQQVLELSIPWLWPSRYMPVSDMFSSPLVSNRPLCETFGTLSIRSIGPLSVATTATGNTVGVKYYVHLEGVEVFGPNRTVQSAMMSSAADMAKKTGVLGSFGDIGYHALKAGSGLLRLAGWSNDPGVEQQSAVNHNAAIGLYSTERVVPCETTSLGAKCNQIVDSSVTGSGDVDELSISSLAGRETYMVNAIWAETQTSGEIMAFAVNPCYKHTYTGVGSNGGTYTALAMGPAAYIAAMHQYWRGTMYFRIKVVASALHRGKLRVAWDTYPTASQTLVTSPVPSHIIDLATASELVFSVPFMSVHNYCRTVGHHSTPSLFQIGTGSSAALANSWMTGSGVVNTISNGFVSITVNSALSSPLSAAPVRVIVTSWCPDLELQSPIDTSIGFPRTSMMDLRSIQALDEIVVVPEDPLPVQRSTEALDEAVDASEEAPIIADSTPNTVSNHFGEQLTSLYQHIHRAEFYMAYPIIPASGNPYRTIWSHIFPRRPPSHGVHYTDTFKGITTGCVTGAAVNPYQYCRDSVLLRLLPCFVGHKGDFRYKVVTNDTSAVFNEYLTLMRAQQYLAGSAISTVTTGKSAVARQLCTALSTAQGGGTLVGPGVLSVDCSEQSALEFQSTNPNFCAPDPSTTAMPLDNLQLTVCTSVTGFGASDIRFFNIPKVFIGAAPNFRLFGFQYCPVIYTTQDVTDFPPATTAPYV